MKKIVGVSFNNHGKIYNFETSGLNLTKGNKVIVETEKGLQYGEVMTEIVNFPVEEVVSLKPVIRVASKKDCSIYEKNVADANLALIKAKEFVKELGLDMKILDASFTFDRKQLLFNFLADDRVDFRELAKKLAQVYRTRIELRQIGVRDKAKEIGGIGPCGRVLCCHSFLSDINSVTINMAKNQSLALNPTKINGVCGRLLCCLGYEDNIYTELKKNLPRVGDEYNKNGIKGKVIEVNIFNRKIKIQKDNEEIVEVIL